MYLYKHLTARTLIETFTSTNILKMIKNPEHCFKMVQHILEQIKILITE